MDIIRNGYPTDYEGYLINPSFINALDIIDCLNDEQFTEQERQAQALYMLYGKGYPDDLELASNGLSWFLNCGEKVKTSQQETQEKSYDFKVDGGRIRSAILRFYNVDISKVELHWFEFCDMLSDLGECGFTNIIDIRTKNLNEKGLSQEVKNLYIKLKERYAIHDENEEEQSYSDEESENIKAFLELVKNG